MFLVHISQKNKKMFSFIAKNVNLLYSVFKYMIHIVNSLFIFEKNMGRRSKNGTV